MRAGRIKNALADLILDLLPEGSGVDVESLRVNRGGNQYNDWCSWTGIVYLPDGRKKDICSWETMTELVKHGSLTWVGGGINDYVGEICRKPC